ASGGECQCPAVLGRQAGIALHGGVVEALGNNLVKGKNAALAGALTIGKRNRRRGKSGGRRAVAGAPVAVAGGAVLGIKCITPRGIRNSGGRKWHGIGIKKIRGKRVGNVGNERAVGLVGNGVLQACGGIQQCLLFRVRGQRGKTCGNGGGKFALFVVFHLVDHGTLSHGAGIVDGNVVKQTPGGLNLAGGVLGVNRQGEQGQ